jgi:hypothetical protein
VAGVSLPASSKQASQIFEGQMSGVGGDRFVVRCNKKANRNAPGERLACSVANDIENLLIEDGPFGTDSAVPAVWGLQSR